VGGGAWPFLVGGAICLVDSDNERDSGLLNSPTVISLLLSMGSLWAILFKHLSFAPLSTLAEFRLGQRLAADAAASGGGSGGFVARAPAVRLLTS